MSGSLLSETSLSDATRRGIANQAGGFLSRIHRISTEGFGYTDGKGQAPCKTALEETRCLLSTTAEFISAGHKAGLESSIIERAIELLIKEATQADTSISCLLHNDFCTKHVLIDEERGTGIIDFGELSGGQQVTDFIRWSKHVDFQLDWLKEGYQDQALFIPEFFRHLQVKQMEMGLWIMKSFVDFPKSIEEARREFMLDLEKVERL